jgi:hypothetical protein
MAFDGGDLGRWVASPAASRLRGVQGLAGIIAKTLLESRLSRLSTCPSNQYSGLEEENDIGRDESSGPHNGCFRGTLEILADSLRDTYGSCIILATLSI